MKQFIIAATFCAVTTAAMAEGYQVNTLSARQNGMGHTGTALHTGSESMIFNPGGLTFMKNDIDVRASFTAIMPTAKATLSTGKTYQTDNKASTPMSINIGMKIYDNLAAGVSFFTPYGSNINWTDNWPGAELNQRVKLNVFTVQPTVAWQPVKNVSIGAGLMLAWGSVNLDKGLVSGQSLDAVLGIAGIDYRFGDTTPASLNLNGKTSLRAGINIGVMWDINREWTVGTSWRSQMQMKVKAGEAQVNYSNNIAETVLESQLNLLNHANFAAQMPAPWVWNAGVAYRPTDKLTLAFDAQLTGWKAYRELNVDFLSEQLSAYDQHITKNYNNSWTFKIGGEYEVTKRFTIRAGMMIDTTPVNDIHYNPETPGMTKVSPSCGLSFYPLPYLSIDASFMYVAGLGKDGECTYTDLLLKREKTFSAHYNVHAFAPSAGLTFHF